MAPDKNDNQNGGVYDKDDKAWNKHGKDTGDSPEKSVSPQDLGQRESSPGGGASSAMDPGESSFAGRLKSAEEKGKLGKGFSGDEPKGKLGAALSMLRGKMTRKNVALTAISGLVVGGGFFGAGMLSGPFQFIHFAQNLQKHFRSNEDFGNDRTSKVLLYALAGRGAQNGRLGVTSNAVANKWERRLLNDTGMRPVYSDGTRRFIGFEIVNESKANSVLGNIKSGDTRRSKKLSQSMGEGSLIRNAGEVGKVIGSDNNELDGNKRIVDLRGVDFAERRAWIKTVSSSTGAYKVSSALNSRLLIKRAGVNFHPLNKAKGKIDDKVADALRKKRETDISNGVQLGPDGTQAANGEPDENGNETAPADEDIDASEETRSIIEEFKNNGALRTARSAAVVTAVLCVAKQFGSNVEDYKYTNNVLPMMRMGMGAVTTGNQTMSGDDLDMGTMGIMVEYMVDEEKNTSVNQAEGYRAINGQSGGVKPSPESELGGIDQKPKFFRLLDQVPVLGQVCTVQNFVGGLPIIKQIGQATGAITDQLLGIFGTSTDEIMHSALKAVAGKSVDPKAAGAEFANLAATGTFLASNDQAISNGGVALSNDERAQLAMLEEGYEDSDMAMKSFASRYFDPYDGSSMASAVIDVAPSSTTQAAKIIGNPVKLIGNGFAKIGSVFTPKAKAATIYDYGVPKYGYSQRDQADPMFEDPYENARIVEDEGNGGQRLRDLNEKYGKCFNMSVTADSSGVHIESGDDSVNVFELEKKDQFKDCRDDKNNEMFKRYRFYLADAVTAISLACADGDDTACGEIGMSAAAGSTGGDDGITSAGAQRIVDVAEQEFDKNGNKVLETCGENCGPEVQKYTGGPSGPDAKWCAWFVSWVYRKAGYEFKGAPAGSDGNMPAVEQLITWFTNRGIHFTPDSTRYKPQPGDVIMYGGGEHTGIVVKVNGDNIETIEGNTSGDESFNANGETVGRKKFNYKTYTTRSIEFGRLKEF